MSINPLQTKASNPQESAWVSASAGTGKTKILTDRVIRLLLEGVCPLKILCLTFTNAAAGEMQERIIKTLKKLSDSALDNELSINLLTSIIGETPSNRMLKRAKSLYTEYITSEEKVAIHTLHSYCQKILQRFPIEAGVTPNFSILDEAGQYEVILSIKEKMLHDQRLNNLNHFLAKNFHQSTLDEILVSILEKREDFTNLILRYNSKDLETSYIDQLIHKASTITYEKYSEILNYPLVRTLIDGVNTESLSSFTPRLFDQYDNVVIANHVSVIQLKLLFLNQKGERRKKIANSKVAPKGSNTYDQLLSLQECIYQMDQLERQQQVDSYSEILTILAKYCLEIYDGYKKQSGYLDYDDLISKSKKLLCDASARNWVLYKLDGGIDHLLVDEAQDTSKTQWEIIEAIIQEFFATAPQDRSNLNSTFHRLFAKPSSDSKILKDFGAQSLGVLAIDPNRSTKHVQHAQNVKSFIDMQNKHVQHAQAELVLSNQSNIDNYKDIINNRTLFVVGDEKQSIFSFQGANVKSFIDMQNKLTTNLGLAGIKFNKIELDVSYRSSQAIIDVVYKIFRNLSTSLSTTIQKSAQKPTTRQCMVDTLSSSKHGRRNQANQSLKYQIYTEDIHNKHSTHNSRDSSIGNRYYIFETMPYLKAYRNNYPGKVELWPIYSQEDQETEFWPIASIKNESETSLKHTPEKRLAMDVADYIHKEIASGKILNSTGKKVSARDFLILFRTRNKLTNLVIEEIQRLSIPITGLDRIKLKDDMLVQDILAFSKFVLNPHDDLNLAALLKAPFLSKTEQQIHDLIFKAKTLVQPLCNVVDDLILQGAYNIYKNSNLSQFFQNLVHFLELKDKLHIYYPNTPSKTLRSIDYDKEYIRLIQNPIADDKQMDDSSAQDSSLSSIHNTPTAKSRQQLEEEVRSYENHRVIRSAISFDAFRELLIAALNYEKHHSSSLQGFIDWFENSDLEIKRIATNRPLHHVASTEYYSSKITSNSTATKFPETVTKEYQAQVEQLAKTRKARCAMPQDLNNTSQMQAIQEDRVDKQSNQYDDAMVRVMTVHGAKGLQAPYVILCDTTSVPKSDERILKDETTGKVLSAKNSSFTDDRLKIAKQTKQDMDYQEYLRLLYVAMTRAEDHLIICGYSNKRSPPENSWYSLIEPVLEKSIKNTNERYSFIRLLRKLAIDEQFVGDAEHKTGARSNVHEDPSTEDSYEILCQGSNAEKFINLTKEPSHFSPEARLESLYTSVPAYSEPSYWKEGSLSTARSTRSLLKKYDALEYGKVFHKILEDSIKNDISLMQQHPLLNTLSDIDRKRMLISMNRLCSNDKFLSLLQGTIKTEVSLGTIDNNEDTNRSREILALQQQSQWACETGDIDEHTAQKHLIQQERGEFYSNQSVARKSNLDISSKFKIGRIDLMVIHNNCINIIDYKSDSMTRDRSVSVIEKYKTQLEFYKDVLSRIYPTHEIRKYILWLEAGSLEYFD